MFKSLSLSVATLALMSSAAVADCGDDTAQTPAVVEIVEFRLAGDVSAEAFVETAAALESAFLCNAPGYIRRTLTQREDGTWLDMVEWTSLDEALAAADAIMMADSAASFMQAIDPNSIKMGHWSVESRTE